MVLYGNNGAFVTRPEYAAAEDFLCLFEYGVIVVCDGYTNDMEGEVCANWRDLRRI